MRAPNHAINGSGRRPMTPERIVGIGFVGLLHVLAIWAIVSGLGIKIVNAIAPKDIQLTLPKNEEPPPPAETPKPPTVELPTVKTESAPPPDITIDQPMAQQPQIVAAVTNPVTPQPITPDTSAAGIMNTHTTPPYPELDRRLGNQGTVKLRLAISPQGIVTSADVVQSSGFPSLDQAAVSWVLGHWKYKPAVQAGSPVASTTVAAVVFNIKNAR